MHRSGFFWIILGIISLILVTIFTIILWYDFKVGCKDYLKLAGDAPTVQKADDFLGKALEYIENNALMNGNSAIIFRTPSADLNIWYKQIKGAKGTVENILERADQSSIGQLERDNALMKVREVVQDEGKKGTRVTAPSNISWFPHQVVIALWWFFSVIFMIIGIVILFLREYI